MSTPLTLPMLDLTCRPAYHRAMQRATEYGAVSAPAHAQAALPPLTLRTVAEIEASEITGADLIFGNGYLARGSRATLLGQGGIGKSRFAVQAMLCARAGLPFLDWPTHGDRLRYLILQTENGNRRLKYDLGSMRRAFTPAQWRHIQEGVFFHTLESDTDGLMLLDRADHFKRAQEAILAAEADVVVLDPLRDFHGDNLNDDAEMTAATRNAAQLVRAGGRGDRALLVLHHARTGRSGIAKAVGFDRGDFGRNSKVLHGWTRAQINVAPGAPDHCDTLVIASGKNNDHREFTPFAVELDPVTMTYHLDPTFDMEAWKGALEGGARRDGNLTAADIRAVLESEGGLMEKKALVEALRKRSGMGRQRAEDAVKAHLGGAIQEVRQSRHGTRHAVFVQLSSRHSNDRDDNDDEHDL
jgi:hypothetical protein